MKLPLLLLGFSCLISSISPAFAVAPAPVSANDNVTWSKVVENPFDGKVIYDRNYKADFILVTSWSRNGIGVTYTQVRTAVIDYDYGHRRGFRLGGFGGFGGFGRSGRFGGFGEFSNDEPVYQRFATENVPDSINLAISGKVYTYQNGPVSLELAAVLASAPPENVKIRLIWQDGRTKDTEIGKDTVRAWRTVFSVHPNDVTLESYQVSSRKGYASL